MERQSRRQGWLCALACLLMMFAAAMPAAAQGQSSATLSGTVTDNVGVIPGATITVTNTAAGVTRTAVSDETGVFRIVSLPPGRYTLKVNLEGFKQIDIADLPLMAGEVRDLGKLTLTAGGVSETINVTAEATPVQTTSSALQKSISGDMLTSLQVKGRDIFGMLKVIPGVVDSSASRDFAAWQSGRNISINGGNSLNKNTTIDGVPVGEEGKLPRPQLVDVLHALTNFETYDALAGDTRSTDVVISILQQIARRL